MTRPAYRRARRSFWMLFIVAVVLTGALYRELRAPPSPRAGLAVAVLGLLAVVAIGLATRVLLALTGRPPRDRYPEGADRPGPPST